MDLTIEFVVPRTPLTTGQGAKVVGEELQAATEYGVNLAQSAILPLVPVDRALLRGSIQTSVVGVGVDLVGRVFTPMAHGLPVEHGSKPHWPPISAIEGWVRRKLDIPESEVPSVAYLVARAISRRGTPARKMFTRGFASVRPRIEQRYEQARTRIMQRLVT